MESKGKMEVIFFQDILDKKEYKIKVSKEGETYYDYSNDTE